MVSVDHRGCIDTANLPAMRLAEAIETTRIHRVTGLAGDRTALVTPRPCPAPSHHLCCGTDRWWPGADAGGRVAGAPWRALPG